MDANTVARIEIFVNGKPHSVAVGTTVAGLLAGLGVDPAKVAVELNRRIVRKAEWATTAVPMGAELEIVHFVGGGRRCNNARRTNCP